MVKPHTIQIGAPSPSTGGYTNPPRGTYTADQLTVTAQRNLGYQFRYWHVYQYAPDEKSWSHWKDTRNPISLDASVRGYALNPVYATIQEPKEITPEVILAPTPAPPITAPITVPSPIPTPTLPTEALVTMETEQPKHWLSVAASVQTSYGSDQVRTDVTIDGIYIGKAPFRKSLTEGVHTVTVSSQVNDFTFERWESGETNPTITIQLLADKQIYARYSSPSEPKKKEEGFNLMSVLPLIAIIIVVIAWLGIRKKKRIRW